MTISVKKSLIFIGISAVLFYFVSELFIDKRVYRPFNMSLYTVSGFYKEPKNTLDIISIGSSQCYTAIIPAVLWRDHGWTSYDFCVEQQPYLLSYYYMKDAVKRHPNALILLEIGEFHPRKQISDEMIYVNLNDMQFSFNKLSAIHAANPRHWFDYLFTINKYHSTWSFLSKSKIDNMFYRGYSFNKGYGEATDDWWEEGKEPKDYDLLQTDREKLDPDSEKDLLRIINYAKKNNVKLVLYKAPSTNLNAKKNVNYIMDIASKYNIPFMDFNTQMIGQHHLNVPQAQQMTALLADYLSKYYTFADKRKDPKYAHWEQSVSYLKQQEQKYRMRKTKDLISLLNILKGNPYYIVLLSVKDSATRPYIDVDRNIIDTWQSFGLKPDVFMASHFGNSYIAVLDGGKVIHEQISPDKLSWKKALKGIDRVFIESSGFFSGNFSSIKINNQEQSPNSRGINIVVYDKWMNDFVLQTTFDAL